MSLDRSLKSGGGLSRHRNVLTREERIKRLAEQDRFEKETSVFGLPKVGNRNIKIGKKSKKKDEAAEGAEATAKPDAKAAAPKKG